MHCTPLLLAIDPALGRLDPMLLSNQAMMEPLIQGCTDTSKAILQDANGEYEEYTAWNIVQCACGGESIIFMPDIHLEGTLSFEFLPRTTKGVYIGLDLSAWAPLLFGTLDTEALPECLGEFIAKWQGFTGTVDMSKLPPNLQTLNIYSNKFSGSADLTALPGSLNILNIGKNKFSGSVNLEKLREALATLEMEENQLCGTLTLDKLPETLTKLNTFRNQFTGDVVIDNLSEQLKDINLENKALHGSVILKVSHNSLRVFSLRENKISGTIVVHSAVKACAFSMGQFGFAIEAVVDENGEERHCHKNRRGQIVALTD